MATTKRISDLVSTQSIGWVDALISRLGAGSIGIPRITITPPSNASALAVSGYSLTGSNAQSLLDLSGTWNTSGTPTLIKANVTDTASNASSLLLDLQVGGTSQFATGKDGYSTTRVGINFGSGERIATVGGRIDFTTNGYVGNVRASLGSAGFHLNGYLSFYSGSSGSNGGDVRLQRDDANILALRNGTNAQAFNVYGTFTSTSVYERMFMRYSTGNTRFEIGTEHLGASSRGLALLIGSTAVLSISTVGNSTFSGSVTVGSSSLISHQARVIVSSPAAGIWTLQNNTQDNWDRLQFGGTTSSFPALKRSTTTLQTRLADDSDFTDIESKSVLLTGGTVTASRPLISGTQTWNDAGVTFHADDINITNTASAAASTVLRRRVGGTTVFSVRRNGDITVGDKLGLKVNGNGGDIIDPSQADRILLHADNAGIVTSYAVGFAGGYLATADAILVRDGAANTLAIRNGTNAQAFNVYNTYSSASVYERGFIRWTSNIFEIGCEHLGASNRQLRLKTNSGVISFQDGNWTMTMTGGTLRSDGSGISLGTTTSPWKDIFLRPSSSLTPNANGDLCIEATNDTTLTFKYKGSDGTVRSGTIALS